MLEGERERDRYIDNTRRREKKTDILYKEGLEKGR